MSRDISPDLQQIRLYLTQPHDCSYLPNKAATTAFVDPMIKVTPELYSQLTHLGFRRSGKYFYSPRCQSCQACISSRIPVDAFRPDRQQKRTHRRNRDLEVRVVETIDSSEHYPLYDRYISNRHARGDMYPPSYGQFMDFLGDPYDSTRYLEFRLDGELLACTVADRLDDGLSAIYTYYAPEHDRRSLGTFAVLSLIDAARQWRLPYIYLGFWIDGCRKMTYKARYQPMEILVAGQWRPLDAG